VGGGMEYPTQELAWDALAPKEAQPPWRIQSQGKKKQNTRSERGRKGRLWGPWVPARKFKLYL
jgi:hypothetical protein